MTYRIANNEKGIEAFGIVLSATRTFKKHPLLHILDEKDKAYLSLVLKEEGEENEGAKTFLLPSKKKVFVIFHDKNGKAHRKLILTARKLTGMARGERIPTLMVFADDFEAPLWKKDEGIETITTQFEIANFEYTKYKTPPKNGWFSLKEVVFFSSHANAELLRSAERGRIIGEEINAARTLSNTPGGDMTPALLAKEAVASGKKNGFRVTVLDEKKIRALKMGGVLGVAQGSDAPPRFIVLEYMKGPKSEKPVVLVGKGVTFDTGGLNLKPESGIYEMHMDMSGGAAVIHTIAALARLKVKKNIVGLIPAVENMPSGSSYRPGDLLTTMSGKTIEVLNTDAEGRIILSDALTYATRFYKPSLVIDIATLTGASMSALGERACALFATDDAPAETLEKIGEHTGDFIWRLPLWEEYESEIKGTFGDVANIGKTRYGGAITAAVFLWQFIKDVPWMHLDIAPRMTSIEGDGLGKGAAGASIHLLASFLRNYPKVR